tara:strand:+ start:162 stop:374 length:213 start_codon:yes stop_codon:yes gene_type:complete
MNNQAQNDFILNDLIYYLENNYGLSQESIELALKYSKKENAPFLIILWNFGFISTIQYEKILKWHFDNNF